jgi:hypothetical protein
MKNFDPENSREADYLLEILDNPMMHIDLFTQVEHMGETAVERKWRRSSCPYFEDTVLENKFRRTWNEATSKIDDRETFKPADVWLYGYDARKEATMQTWAADQKLGWKS